VSRASESRYSQAVATEKVENVNVEQKISILESSHVESNVDSKSEVLVQQEECCAYVKSGTAALRRKSRDITGHNTGLSFTNGQTHA